MRENRLYGSEGGGPQPNAALLPLSVFFRSAKERASKESAFVEGRHLLHGWGANE
jgi:hypothetical protein